MDNGLLYDKYNRKIEYLRLSVIDKCNLRCTYCRPAADCTFGNDRGVLSYEEMAAFVRVGVEMGINKVRITGGEPLVRRDVVELVRMLAGIPGIRDLSMTTNATLLAPLAKPLKEAGLHRINISLDAVDPKRFFEITRTNRLADVIRGIDAALEAGLQPVKLNCVVKHSPDEPDAVAVSTFAMERGLPIRFIREMNLGQGEFWQVIGGSGGLCSQCNRLRLTCQGRLLPCLFSDVGFDIRELGPREALRQAVGAKPQSGRHSKTNHFYSVGG